MKLNRKDQFIQVWRDLKSAALEIWRLIGYSEVRFTPSDSNPISILN